MPNSYTNARPFSEENGMPPAPAAPRPFTLAAQESINPVPKLLLSFPVPRMISQMHLETPWPSEEDTPAGAADSTTNAAQRGGWSSGELDGVVRGMHQSAQHLLLTGRYEHFFQEQLHHEVDPRITETDEGVRGEERAADPFQVARHVSTAAAPGIKKLLSSMGQQSTVLEVPLFRKNHDEPHKSSAALALGGETSSRQRVPLTRVPKTEMWTKSEDELSMGLRPRRLSGLGGAWADVSSESLDSAVGGGGGGGAASVCVAPSTTTHRRGGAVAASSSSRAVLPACRSYEPRTGAAGANWESVGPAAPHEGSASLSFADWVCHQRSTGPAESSLPSLLYFISVLPLQLHPFDSIKREQLSHLLASLVAAPTEEAAASSAKPTTPTERGEDDDALRWSARGLLCCQCLAHPHFPTEAVPDGVVGRVIDIFARLVRDVSMQLQEGQHRSAGAALTEKENEEGGAKRRSSMVGKRSGSNNSTAAAAAASTSSLLPSLEQLRGFIGAFALIVCNAHLRLAVASDVLRLEELCHHCLFRLTRTCTKELHALCSSYVVDTAVRLYRCLWNRLDVQRQRTAENFFQQLPVSEFLTQRSYQTHFDGRAVLPLTVAVLAAAQSTPLPLDAIGAADAEALQRQCGLWVNGFIQEFLLSRAGERDKADGSIAWTATIRMAEDLADLLGVPEWPGADLLLRSLVMALAQVTLGSEGASSPSAEALRPLTIDVLGHVAVKLFDAPRFPVAAAILAEMERLGESASTSQAAARLALQHVVGTSPPLRSDDQLVWEHLCGSAVGASAADGTEEDHRVQDLIAAVYLAESRLIADPSTSADYASVWLHVRAARLISWVCLHDVAGPDWVPPANLDALVRWKGPPGGSSSNSNGQSTNWGDVCAWTQAVSTQSGKSMLSLRMRHTLVSMLFSVFHLRDAQEAAVPVTEVVQRKTLAHLARLTTLHPPLHRYLWPIVRQCVRDDSARVRESIVPLLLTLLSDAAAAEVNTDASSAGQLPALSREGITAEVISSLLHLLADKSVSVASRTITALDTFLTDHSYQYLFTTPQGASLISFIQQKLLFFASPTAEPKHHQEVVKHFLHRWVVTLADSDGSLTGAHAQLAKELVTLTVAGATDFPYDVTDEHLLVQLLQRMHAHISAHDPAIEGARQATAIAAAAANASVAPTASPHPKRRSRGYRVDVGQLLHVMRCAAQSLWMRYQCFHSGGDAVACLATLRVLTLARSEWVMPLAEVLVQALAYPPPTTSPLASAAEALGGSLLQLCQILHGVLHAPKRPLISLDYLARCLTTLLSKYVGPYQQRVIVASCGALCALITCGAKHRLSAQVNVPYLQLCYSLMNTYYCRVRALLPTLATQPHSVAYTQRFLFLLSEFLRMYPGWKQQPPHPALVDAAVGSSGAQANGASATPNQLASGPGITANTYQLLEDVLQSCSGSRIRERVVVIALRVVASLCMLDPTTYFHRAETQIRDALTSADHNLQLQGLSLLSDFLKEEDERVDAAAHNAARLDTTALIVGSRASASTSRSGSRSSEDEKSSQRSKAKARPATAPGTTRQGRGAKQVPHESSTAASASTRKASGRVKKVAAAASAAAATTEDFNSGMSTWIFQQFHGDIARLGCSSAHVPVRSLCLRLFRQAAQGGLLPPDKYVRVVIALAADVHAPLRQQAAASLAAHCDRHEEVVSASVGRGVVLAFDLHHACRAHLLRSAVVVTPSPSEPAGTSGSSSTGEQSVHGVLYALLHKRSRDNMITTLVRLFYQDARVTHWCAEHAEELAVWASPLTAAATVAAASPVGIFGAMHPLLFLSHLTLVLFTLPFQHESDVMHVLQQCRVALDLNGQSALDWLKDTDADAVAGGGMTMQWKAIGALLLYYLRRALFSEYRLSETKVQRYRTRDKQSRAGSNGHGSAPLRGRDAAEGLGAATALMKRLQELVERVGAALVAALGKEGRAARTAAWQYVSAELETALMTETAEDSGREGTALSGERDRKRTRTGGKASGAEEKQMKKSAARKRKRARSSSGEETPSSAEDSDEEVTSPSTASRSVSATRSTPTSSLSSSSASATPLIKASVDRLAEEDDGDA
ncbi:hypothetical protein ABB37_07833 [Leptomonas pyrrhocoris]|uniref:Sister chromatid cohesion protein n=1 Tax=Leptomonas pyrrhocoris TaxID=157538 RepID=A0A0N0DSU9_LEPPY|nr:hypothetical protein ABB37_07833 [Leptomonas pyrrhocoris]KPA76541.1 hypothetical protein ABB37_07833 [Leptomonas pyrrhocoris]|eukprot:XP_015654980.1 hypothetical protein ABB37_07833 [Leptomonas pyrrhocoris]